jgi:hypothetical protein
MQWEEWNVSGTYLSVPKGEGLWLQIPTVNGFVIWVVESCRNRGRRRMLRDSLDRSSWVELQEIKVQRVGEVVGGLVMAGRSRRLRIEEVQQRWCFSLAASAFWGWRLPFSGGTQAL